jgi:predicted lipoprotein with Yx(FWY)xxD motif
MAHPYRRRAGSTGLAAVAVVGLALALSACSSSPSSSSSNSSTSSTGAPSASATVKSTSSAQYGAILVDSAGMTLYMLSSDTPTTSTCTGSCVSIWPPLISSGTPLAGPGLNASLLGTLTRSDGSKQVTYNGHPLYTYSGDSSAGQVNGEGIKAFGGTWYVLDTAGQAVTKPMASSTSTTSGGYSY